jgi:DNA primase
MRYPPSLLDDIRARLPVSQVVGRRVQLKKAGREWRGLSPFKSEKTPSFYVNDQKGFYHCFASGAHGDIFKFLMETEGLSFVEAVERLAGEAGVPLPKPDPRFEGQFKQQEDERQRYYKLLEASAQFFEQELKAQGGGEARRYLTDKRGLAQATIAQFRLGFAPQSRNALKTYLAKAGFTVEDMVTTGMLIGGDDIPLPYDRFRNRVMFPILDLKGRVIAFGGRALEADAPAKYLNSPETPLFHKGSVLFNAAAARQPSHQKSRIIAVEGYMDVVALTAAGYPESVAPLGTALTEDQIGLLWRFCEEPTLCFDGDNAGIKAAHRAVDTVLPLLKPGFSVKFAFLPDKLDPDELIRARGRDAFEAELGKTRALLDVLWERELNAQPVATPEQRAALEKRIKGLVDRIADPSVKQHYGQELRQTLWSFNRSATRALGQMGGSTGKGQNDHGREHGLGGGFGQAFQLRNKLSAAGDWRIRQRALQPKEKPKQTPAKELSTNELLNNTTLDQRREALLIKTLFNHIWLLDDDCETVADLHFTTHGLDKVRDALLAVHAAGTSGDAPLDNAEVRSQLANMGLEQAAALAERSITHRSDRFAEPDAGRDLVETGWRHILGLQQQASLRFALEAAEAAFFAEQTDDTLARITELKRLIATTQDASRQEDGPIG